LETSYQPPAISLQLLSWKLEAEGGSRKLISNAFPQRVLLGRVILVTAGLFPAHQ
jgi:hypothetical protein